MKCIFYYLFRPELQSLIDNFNDFCPDDIISVYFDCDNNYDKTVKTLKNMRNKSNNNNTIVSDDENLLNLIAIYPHIDESKLRRLYKIQKDIGSCIDLIMAIQSNTLTWEDVITEEKVEDKKNTNIDNDWNNNINGLTLVERMRFNKLCEDYCNIEKSVLFEIYMDNNKNRSETERVINSTYLDIKKKKKKEEYRQPEIVIKNVSIKDNSESSLDNEINRLDNEVKQQIAKAHKYYSHGKKWAGQFEMQRVSDNLKKLKGLKKEKLKYVYNKKNNNINECDLHGQNLETAIEFLEEAIEKCRNNNIHRLHIITGVGKHSIHNKAVLLPEVKKYLDRNNYSYTQGTGDFYINI